MSCQWRDDDTPVGGLVTAIFSSTVGCCGAAEGLVPRAEKGLLAINIIICQLSQSWKKGDLNLIHLVPKNELVWVLQALWKDNETSIPKLPKRRALLQAVKLFPVTRGPDTPESFNCRVSLQWKPWHPMYWLCCGCASKRDVWAHTWSSYTEALHAYIYYRWVNTHASSRTHSSFINSVLLQP